MTNSRKVECGDCGAPVSAEIIGPEENQNPCPVCGSTRQNVRFGVSDGVSTMMRDALKGKLKDDSFPSRKKVRKEMYYGSDVRKSRGDYVYKERVIDRDANHYRELVREETGEIISDVEHPLKEHIGHGSAKFNASQNGNDDETD